MAAKRRRGQRTGSVPFGSALAGDGRRSKGGRRLALGDDPAEREALAVILALRAEGRSLRAIAAELDRRAIPPKNGGPRWIHTAVAKLLARQQHQPPQP